MNNILKRLFLLLFTASLAFAASPALAYSPSLGISGSTGGDVVITVSGAAPNSSIQLSYTVSGSSQPTVINNFGTTDGSGYFSTSGSSSSYGLNSGALVYVTVGGQQSNTASLNYGGCGYGSYGNCGGNLSLSQTSMNLTVGQSFGIVVYNGGGNLYISSNSNPAAVSAGVAGNTVNVSGLSNGSATVAVCSNSNSSCASVYVTVGGGNNYNYGNLSLSQTSLNLNVGQSSTVNVYNSGNYYSGSYYISQNSNSNVATASISNSSIYVYAQNSGSTTIAICQSGSSSSCASLYVTVGGGGYGSLSLSQSNVSMTVNQSATVSAYNTSGGNLYVSSNSNPNVVSATASGQTIYLDALSGGTSNLTICAAYSSQCANLYVTVGNVAGASNYAVGVYDNYFSPSNITIPAGGSVTWTNYGTMVHTVTADNGNFDSGSLSVGSSFTWTFNTAGSYRYYCRFHGGPNGTGMSGVITVSGGTPIAGGLSFTNQNPSLSVGQGVSISVTAPYYYSGSYYVSSNSNLSAVSASISGGSNTINLTGLNNGSSTIIVCQNSAPNSCGTLYATVSGSGNYGNASLSQNSLVMNVGQSSTVNIYGSGGYYGNYYISQNSNSNVATASISGNTLYVYAQNSGNSTITVCQNGSGSSCASLYVTVSSSNYGSGSLNLSQNNLTLNVSQSATVNVYNNNYYSGSYYISQNSNSNVATASISNSSIYVYAQNSGSTTMTICQSGSSSSCASLYVTVLGYGGYYGGLTSPLNFTSTSLPAMTVGQYYNVQLQVVGGTPPYTYTLSSGSLPSGLSLSNMGQIFGTPQNVATASFSVMAMDSVGRSVTANFNITSGGSQVLGLSTFNNGTLISENGTVYIIYKNTKTGFANVSAFLGLGFKFSQVVNVLNSGLSGSGYTVTTANASHPWGSWVKSGNTVYFVHESGLIPVPDWNTFLNNGGQANLIVPANIYDFQLPLLSPMSVNDLRMQ